MRKTAICLVAFLGSWVTALAQTPVHQWKVVQVVHLTQQTSAIPATTLLMPTKIGLYRVTLANSCEGSDGQGPYWDLLLISKVTGTVDVACDAGDVAANFVILDLKPGASVTYSSEPTSGTPTFAYGIDIVVEQFQ
ncbi:MAG: hypothetical protein WAN65_14485 [Candidatus Sulfotelmatobacter sp.]